VSEIPHSELTAKARNQDDEQLNLLSVFHYVVGGLTCLFACFPLIYIGIGIFMLVSPAAFNDGHSREHVPPAVGILFVVLGSVFFLIGLTIGVLIIMSGRHLARRTRYMFAFVTACVECIFMPFGTILGVFTILVLSRESVKTLFGHKS